MYNDANKVIHSPAMKMLGTVLWVIVAVGALNWGLDALGYNIFNLNFVQMNIPYLVYPVKLIVGAAGLSSLIYFALYNTTSHPHCSC